MQSRCLCPFKTKPLVRYVFFSPLFPPSSFLSLLPSSPSSPLISLFSLFKLWRCCIRYTVILNEQWGRRSARSVSFLLPFFFSVAQFGVSQSLKLDEMYSTCLWNQECVCVCQCVYECVCVFDFLSKWNIDLYVLKKKKRSSHSVSVRELLP